MNSNTQLLLLLLLTTVLAVTFTALTQQRETLIPYELAFTLPGKMEQNPPHYRNGPFPSQRNMQP